MSDRRIVTSHLGGGEVGLLARERVGERIGGGFGSSALLGVLALPGIRLGLANGVFDLLQAAFEACALVSGKITRLVPLFLDRAQLLLDG